jgi:hypothetical protein
VSLLKFYEAKRPKSYETNWHHRWICDVVERAYRERKHAIIEVPPRHGKSEICNVYGPASRLETHHDAKFGLICNADTLSKKFSTACRALVGQPLAVERDSQWKLASASDSLDFSYFGSSIRGQITGFGFDTVIFDDLLKSGLEAKSDTVRETVWENVASAAINRLTPDGIVIALQARLHQQDIIGKLVALDAFKCLHLHLPATNDSGSEAWFHDGYSGDRVAFPRYSALWPTRYSRAKLDEIRATVTPYYWSAQYQQEPSLGDLSYFDVTKFPRYESVGFVDHLWIAVDAANTATESGSYSAFVALGFSRDHIKVLSVRRGRWRQDRMIDELWEFYQSLQRLTGLRPSAVLVERAAAGYGIIDHLSGKMPIVPVYPKGSKEERAGAVCYIPNRGQVQLPMNGTWVRDFTDELENFPLSSTNDMVDAFVHALSYVARASEFKFEEQTYTCEYDALAAYHRDDPLSDEVQLGLDAIDRVLPRGWKI